MREVQFPWGLPYLLKPIAFDELEETIASAVEKLEEYKTKTTGSRSGDGRCGQYD